MPPALALFDIKTRLVKRRDRRAAADSRAQEGVSVERLRDLQSRRSLAMALHAFRTSPFYRERYTAAGITERDLSQADTFDHLPLLEKKDLREAGDALLSSAARQRDVLTSVTGGSTGEPLVVRHDRHAPIAAMWWRVYRWWGITPADNVGHILRLSRTPRQERWEQLLWWPTRHIRLDARDMNPLTMGRFAEDWRTSRPRLLNGYVEGVHEFAQFALEHGLALPRPTAVAVTASMLHAPQRAFIQSVLGAPVYDCYRSAEVPWMAAECGFGTGLHVMADVRRLEVIGPDGRSAPPGIEGDIVVSDLTNRVFPLLRYRIGDRSALLPDACPCGRPLPLIQPISGRIADVLHGADGRMVTGGFGSLFNHAPLAVRQFQIHQVRDRTVLLRCVPGPAYEPAAVETVAAGLRQRLGGTIPVRVELVETIGHAGGKVRLVTSELA